MFNINSIREDFPILKKPINGCRNCFLDTAASAQKPLSVIEESSRVYKEIYSNVHRGQYHLSELITHEYENARNTVKTFINAASSQEVVFTRNATESINLVASSWGQNNLKQGDEVLISEAEHHANLVPWQNLRDKLGIILKVFKLEDDGSFSLDNFKKALNENTKLVAVTAQSNVLGTIYPIQKITQEAHLSGAKVLIDACQYIVHHNVDIKSIDCDFLVFSSHKLYGPTGLGVLYGKKEILDSMPPYQFGGDMVKTVTFEKTTFAETPAKFEAGTPAFVEALGLKKAIEYFSQYPIAELKDHEDNLINHMLQGFDDIKGLTLIGPRENRSGVFAFKLNDIHPSDLAFILDKQGISIRSGHHCAEPIVNRFGHTSLARASFGMYTDIEDINQFIKALHKAKTFF